MIRTIGCSWLCRQPCAPATCDLPVHDPEFRVLMVVATTMDNRWSGSCPPPVGCRTVGTSGRDRVDPSGPRLVSCLPVCAPFPARASRRPHPRSGLRACSRRFASTPSPYGGGWVGVTTVPWGCVDGRPRLGGTPVYDETVAAGCLRHWLWSRPSTLQPLSWMVEARPLRRGRARPQVHDQQERDISCRGAAQVPIPLITPQVPGVARGRGSGPPGSGKAPI
jgi:hypothetical protein